IRAAPGPPCQNATDSTRVCSGPSTRVSSIPELMRFLGVRVGMVLAVVAGCHAGGTLGGGGSGTLSGIAGRPGSGSGGGTSVVLGTGGAGPSTGIGGSTWTVCGQTP